MTCLWDFFEEFDELVYVSDPETYEIVYMNRKLRESLGYQNRAAYVGKKCYKVLHGCDEPCSFCTNSVLEKGRVTSWVHSNPVLGKRFLIKDSLVDCGSKSCRLELAIDIDSEVVCNVPYYYARSESILNECLQRIVSTTDPEVSLHMMLEYIGQTFRCDRVYIFESQNGYVDNTYEWCADDVSQQKEILQKLPMESVDWWYERFEKNELVTIYSLEDIRDQYPTTYAILKPQDISRLVAGPIFIENSVVGCLGVDNPDEDMMMLVGPLIKVIGYFIVALLRRRDLLRHLNTLSFHDPLTGAYNRNAMFEHSDELQKLRSVGIVYCDITGLKQTNDALGHSAGDQLIQYCFEMIHTTLDTPWVYRIGGDEFVAVFRDCDEEKFRRQVKSLHQRVRDDKHHIAIGEVWSNQPPYDLEALIIEADKMMYEDKREYYTANYRVQALDRHISPCGEFKNMAETGSVFYQFLGTTYHDMEQLFKSMTQQNSTGYFFFGDMQKDLYYISDNMRDEFGFESNVVPGLIQAWAQRISQEKARNLYWKEMRAILSEKRGVHDLRYQVRNVHGKNMWIRSYGIVKWNEEQSAPLFFSGRITHQDDEFVVDSVTNFPREAALFSRLEEMKGEGKKAQVIAFSFNNISEINSTRGRVFSDHLVRTITENLTDRLADRMSFYRLEGMRCAVLVEFPYEGQREKLVQQIREIVGEWYRLMGSIVAQPCSFAAMEYPLANLMPADFMEQLVSLLRIAKHDPSGETVEYSEENISKVRYMSNMALALSHDVLHGMKNFRVVVQPVVSTQTGKIVGGEMLLRWRFRDRDVSPDVFVTMLEKDNMINIVGRWVFEQAVCTCMRLVSYSPDFYLTFNVSLQQMTDETFPDYMEEVLSKYKVDGSRLAAEMTESCIDEQPEKLIHFVETCSRLGIRIALDDFGSGYSSIRMLLQYPTSIVKLDRSLLGEMTESVDKMNFICSIVYACHRFGKKVCMEGVETAEQDALIRESGCDMIQGYYHYYPLEIAALYSLLADEKKDGSACKDA